MQQQEQQNKVGQMVSQRESINLREQKREEERRVSQAIIDNHFNSIIKRNTLKTNIALLRLEPINMN